MKGGTIKQRIANGFEIGLYVGYTTVNWHAELCPRCVWIIVWLKVHKLYEINTFERFFENFDVWDRGRGIPTP